MELLRDSITTTDIIESAEERADVEFLWFKRRTRRLGEIEGPVSLLRSGDGRNQTIVYPYIGYKKCSIHRPVVVDKDVSWVVVFDSRQALQHRCRSNRPTAFLTMSSVYFSS